MMPTVARLATAAVGIMLMAAPDLVGYDGPLRSVHLVTGPLLVAASVIALWPATAALRWIGLVVGIGLLISAGLDGAVGARLLSAAGGIGVAVLALPRSGSARPLGGGWRVLWHTEHRDDRLGVPH